MTFTGTKQRSTITPRQILLRAQKTGQPDLLAWVQRDLAQKEKAKEARKLAQGPRKEIWCSSCGTRSLSFVASLKHQETVYHIRAIQKQFRMLLSSTRSSEALEYNDD
jgi:hypothetical protein